MTDKPDVAALIAELREHASMYGGMTRIKFDKAIAELTRLAAENRTYAEAHTFNSERFGEMLSERDAAKAEIARLREVIRIAKDALRGHDPEQPYMKAIRAALKPDMPRQYSIGELAAAVTLAKANLVGGPELDKQFKAYVEAVEAALKPDTGETP